MFRSYVIFFRRVDADIIKQWRILNGRGVIYFNLRIGIKICRSASVLQSSDKMGFIITLPNGIDLLASVVIDYVAWAFPCSKKRW